MKIDSDAPVQAWAAAFIAAPLDLVWRVQADPTDWPRWNPDVQRVDFPGPLASGTEFRWKAGGVRIVSRLEAVDPPRELGWTGRSLGLRAVHVWRFEEAEGGTRVETEESFSGVPARLFAVMLRRTVASSLDTSLRALREECERQAGQGRGQRVGEGR
jgi:hypothetical protein